MFNLGEASLDRGSNIDQCWAELMNFSSSTIPVQQLCFKTSHSTFYSTYFLCYCYTIYFKCHCVSTALFNYANYVFIM